MRVILNQEEIVEAISDYLRDKLNLDNTASVEMSFTAGRAPNGYSASVDITYPKNEGASRFAVHASQEAAEDAPEAFVGTDMGKDSPEADASQETSGEALVADTPSSPATPNNLFGT